VTPGSPSLEPVAPPPLACDPPIPAAAGVAAPLPAEDEGIPAESDPASEFAGVGQGPAPALQPVAKASSTQARILEPTHLSVMEPMSIHQNPRAAAVHAMHSDMKHLPQHARLCRLSGSFRGPMPPAPGSRRFPRSPPAA
jgi:hypothetical protein